MQHTLAFDVYGTLIDTNGVILTLQKMVGDKAAEFSRVWREKQLEYSFRRGLMQRYRNFSVCTREELDYTCTILQVDLGNADRNMLMDTYRVLPAFGDVAEALKQLDKPAYRLYAFSNGQTEAVRGLLEHAGILDCFIDIVSVDEVKRFKPDPAVYQHMLKRCGSTPDSTWLISSNPFDILGARSAGVRGIWLQRSATSIFDPWDDLAADATISLLTQLDAAIQNCR